MQVYIHAKSKAEVNRKLADGTPVFATEIKLGSVTEFNFSQLPDGTVVKIYDKIVCGSPYAKAYGNKKGNKLV